MVHRSMENLKFDRRLAARRGWAGAEDLAAHEKDLADATDKGERVALESAATPSGDEAAEPPKAR